MSKHFKGLICVPSNGPWNEKMSMCFAGMLAHFSHAFPGYISQEVKPFATHGSILPQLRQKALTIAQQQNCTHLLYVDSDMTFPADTLHRLVAHDRPVVAANCATKTHPSNPTARRFNVANPAGDLVYSHDQRGLQRVWRVGTGIMLIKLSSIAHIPAPHFGVTWSDDTENFIGEDWFFCEKLQKHDVSIMVDHDLSRQIGHVGSYTFTHDDIATALAVREIQGERPKANDERQLQLAV